MSDLETELRAMVEMVADQPVDVTDRFADLENWTSLGALRLLAMIEQRLAVTLDLRDYISIQTVGGLVEAVATARRMH